MAERPQRPQRHVKQDLESVKNNVNIQTPVNASLNQQIPIQKSNLTAEEQVLQMLNEKKRKRKKNIITILIVILVIAISSVGIYFIATGRISSKVTSLEGEVESLQTTLQNTKLERDKKVAELEQAIKDTTVQELVPTTSLQRVEGSEIPELWLLEGDFIAPNPLELPTTSDSVNNSYIQIGEKYVFRPSERWIMVSQGSTYEFSHPQKIWGKIRALNAKENVEDAQMQQTIQNFFIGYPATTITYRKIYYDTKVIGMMGRAKVTVKYNVSEDTLIDVAVEKEVDVPYEVEEEYVEDVPYTETITNEDGTTSEVEKVRQETKTRTVTKYEKKTVTINEPQSQTNSIEKEKEIEINVGFLQKSGNSLSFLFIYDVEGGTNSQELVDSLLRTCSYGISGDYIKLE